MNKRKVTAKRQKKDAKIRTIFSVCSTGCKCGIRLIFILRYCFVYIMHFFTLTFYVSHFRISAFLLVLEFCSIVKNQSMMALMRHSSQTLENRFLAISFLISLKTCLYLQIIYDFDYLFFGITTLVTKNIGWMLEHFLTN